MAIRNVIVRGRVGFAAGDVKYLFTHGLNIGEAAAATEATAFLDFAVTGGRIHYTPTTKPSHFVAKTKPFHYTGTEP